MSSLGRERGCVIAELELLPPPGDNYALLPLQLPGAWTESGEISCEELVKATARPSLPWPFLPLREELAEPPSPQDASPVL